MTTAEDAKWRRWALLGTGLLAIVAGLGWWLMPGEVERTRGLTNPIRELQVENRRSRRRVVKVADVEESEADGLLQDLEDNPDVVLTPKCRLLISYERKHVPQFTVLDTLRDQSMVFTEDDLGCLTAGGASPAVLDLAEQRPDYNALRGIKGTPGKNMTNEHEQFFNHPRNRKK